MSKQCYPFNKKAYFKDGMNFLKTPYTSDKCNICESTTYGKSSMGHSYNPPSYSSNSYSSNSYSSNSYSLNSYNPFDNSYTSANSYKANKAGTNTGLEIEDISNTILSKNNTISHSVEVNPLKIHSEGKIKRFVKKILSKVLTKRNVIIMIIIFFISIISCGVYCYIYYRNKKKELQLPLLPTKDEIRNEDKVLVYFNDFYLNKSIRKLLGVYESDTLTTRLLYTINGVLNLKDRHINDIMGLEHIINITGIDLSMNNIIHIPYISKNLFGFFNRRICIFEQIKHLQYINLSSNKISDPSILFTLKNLIKLDLSNNNIKTIDKIRHLNQLQYLDLANNYIDNIYELTKLKKLNILNISYNNLHMDTKENTFYREKINNNNIHLAKFYFTPQKV